MKRSSKSTGRKPLSAIRREVRKAQPKAFEHHWRDQYIIYCPLPNGGPNEWIGTGKTKREAWTAALSHWLVTSRLT